MMLLHQFLEKFNNCLNALRLEYEDNEKGMRI